MNTKLGLAVNEAYSLTENVLGQEVKLKLDEEKNKLLSQLEKDKYIKIPFVGDFSSGKSSLINALLGRYNLLPTSISPLTAVSYELYYDVAEKLEHTRGGNILSTYEIQQIEQIKVEPGDIVRVYLDNEQVKKWNDKGIVVVDMPGIDSGVEAHNDAIMNYIAEGTCFVVAVDCEQGTIRNSTINFLKEIKEYNLSAIVTLTKADKKPGTGDLQSIQNTIQKQVDVFLPGAKVGATSSANKDIEYVLNAIDTIDVNALIKQKYLQSIMDYVDKIVRDIKNELAILSTNREDLEDKKKKIEEEFSNTIKELEEKKKDIFSEKNSANDILYEVEEVLKAKSRYFATILYSNRNNTEVFNTELINTIRPVIIDSIGKEINEYANSLGHITERFRENTNIIVTKGSKIEDLVLTSLPTIETLLVKQATKWITKIAMKRGLGSLLGMATMAINPIIGFVISILPDILSSFFGKSKESQIDDIEGKFRTEIIPTVIGQLRPEIEATIHEEEEQILADVEKDIEVETSKLRQQIEEIEKKHQLSAVELEARKPLFEMTINQLNNIKLRFA